MHLEVEITAKQVIFSQSRRIPDASQVSRPLVCVKDARTYLLGGTQPKIVLTPKDTIKLFRDGEEIFHHRFRPKEFLDDAVYLPELDCFYILAVGRIYRKDINSEPLKLIYDLKASHGESLYLRYSNLNDLLYLLTASSLAVIDLKTKKIQCNYTHGIRRNIADCLIYGEDEDRFLILTENSRLLTLGYNGSIKIIQDKNLGPKGKWGWQAKSKFRIFETSDESLISKASCELSRDVKSPHPFTDLCFFEEYSGGDYLFVGFSKDEETDAFILLYDSKENRLRELWDKRRLSLQVYPVSAAKVGSEVFVIGRKLELCKLVIHNQ